MSQKGTKWMYNALDPDPKLRLLFVSWDPDKRTLWDFQKTRAEALVTDALNFSATDRFYVAKLLHDFLVNK